MPQRAEKLVERLKAGEMLLADGAWSTQMQALGLQSGQCPEEWNVSEPEKVKQIARSYLEAGADLIVTNTFGGTKFRLVRHGFADRVREFNRAGAALCREVAEQLGGFVAASVGPTGEFLEPEGMVKEREMFEAFSEQMAALKEGGAHGVCIETMYVLEEALVAIRAAHELGLFCIASMTFESTPSGFATMLGTPLDSACLALESSTADVLGTNCGNGSVEMLRLARRMRLFTGKPLLVKPNAGAPDVQGKDLLYHETPQAMAARMPEFRAAGIAIVGGCCGTTPEHIRQFRTAINLLKHAQG